MPTEETGFSGQVRQSDEGTLIIRRQKTWIALPR